MSTVPIPEPRVGPLSKVAPKPIKFVLNWGRRYSLWVFNFGLACCAIEFIATSMSRHDFIRLGVIPFAPGPRQADLMVVSGTVSDKMAPAVKRLYEQMPEPKYVISFGACSNCGGPYWDSYCVTKGVDQIIPVDVYIPGCPPRPEALLHGIIHLQEKIAGESLGDRYTNGNEPVAPSPPVRPFSATTLRRPPIPPPPIPETLAHAEQQTLQLRPVDPDEERSAGTVPLAQIPDADTGPSTGTTPLREVPEAGTAPLPEAPEAGTTPLPEARTAPLGEVPEGSTTPLREIPEGGTEPLTELKDADPSPTGTVPLRELPDPPAPGSPDSAATTPLTELPDADPGHPAADPPPQDPPAVRNAAPSGESTGTNDAATGTPGTSASRGSPDAGRPSGPVAGWTDPAAGTMPLLEVPEPPKADPPARRETTTNENRWGRRARTDHLEDDPSIVPGLIEDDDEIGRSGR